MSSMAKVNLDRNIDNPDALYELLVDLNEADDVEKALTRVNRLALILANHIGDRQIISEAIEIAKRDS